MAAERSEHTESQNRAEHRREGDESRAVGTSGEVSCEQSNGEKGRAKKTQEDRKMRSKPHGPGSHDEEQASVSDLDRVAGGFGSYLHMPFNMIGTARAQHTRLLITHDSWTAKREGLL